MRVLVTGSNGQLGRELRRSSSGSGDTWLFSDIQQASDAETYILDVCNADALGKVFSEFRPDVVVNCAAFTAVDRAEDMPDAAYRLNVTAVEYLSSLCADYGSFLIHISTDYVFDGKACSPYTESSDSNPLNVYGKTKLEGENAVLKSACKYLIIRTSWLYSPYGGNFVKTMLSLTESRDSISVVCDQVGTPTYAADLADVINRITEGRLFNEGVFHFSDEGAASWYDLACAVNELSGHECAIRPCRSDEYPTKALRPSYSVFDKSLIKSTFDLSIPWWRTSLEHCLARMTDVL